MSSFRSHSVAGPSASLNLLGLVLLAVASSASCPALDKVFWGRSSSDLRAGVSLRNGSSGTELRVVFENLSHTPQSLLVGSFGGFSSVVGPTHAFFIKAIGPDGQPHPIFYRTGGLGQLIKAGLINHYVERVPPGGIYEFKHPLNDLFEYNMDADIPLENLLHRGYAVRIDYDVQRDSVNQLLYEHPDLWTGQVQSGAVRLSRSSRR